VKAAWETYYCKNDEDGLFDEDTDSVYIFARQHSLVTLDNADAIAVGVGNSAFTRFQRFTASVELALQSNAAELNKGLQPSHEVRPALKAWSRSEIVRRAAEPWLIPGIIQRFPSSMARRRSRARLHSRAVARRAARCRSR